METAPLGLHDNSESRGPSAPGASAGMPSGQPAPLVSPPPPKTPRKAGHTPGGREPAPCYLRHCPRVCVVCSAHGAVGQKLTSGGGVSPRRLSPGNRNRGWRAGRPGREAGRQAGLKVAKLQTVATVNAGLSATGLARHRSPVPSRNRIDKYFERRSVPTQTMGWVSLEVNMALFLSDVSLW